MSGIFCLLAVFCLSGPLIEGKPVSKEESSNERRQFQDKLEDTSSGIGKMINGIAHLLGDGDVVPGGPDGEESEDDHGDDEPTESGASIYNHPLPWMAFHHPPYSPYSPPYSPYAPPYSHYVAPSSPYAPPYAGYHVPPYAVYAGAGYAYHQPAVTTTYHHNPSTTYHAPPFPAALPAALPSFSGVPSGLPSGYGYQAVPWGYKLVEPGPVATHFEYHHGDVAPATPAPEPKPAHPKNVVINLDASLGMKNFPTPAPNPAAAGAPAPAILGAPGTPATPGTPVAPGTPASPAAPATPAAPGAPAIPGSPADPVATAGAPPPPPAGAPPPPPAGAPPPPPAGAPPPPPAGALPPAPAGAPPPPPAGALPPAPAGAPPPPPVAVPPLVVTTPIPKLDRKMGMMKPSGMGTQKVSNPIADSWWDDEPASSR
ncbi:uncharacterized protein LOC142354753 isoform X1 [Convolutriloba macropyga]|uniref:uncharacterized protein LOC142354753 isoform X1 n=1 Tax=Convolutriloba macropyga TaxID=536237 RepID=UPI003F51FA56